MSHLRRQRRILSLGPRCGTAVTEMTDALLADTDIEEAFSAAYAHAVAAGAGYVVSQKTFDRDGVDLTIEAGGDVRPKLDIQLKSTINLTDAGDKFQFPLRKRNYDLLRIACQTPRILVVMHLPTTRGEWLGVTPSSLILRNCAFWLSLRNAPASDNATSVTVSLPKSQRFDIEGLQALMEQSRTGSVT